MNEKDTLERMRELAEDQSKTLIRMKHLHQDHAEAESILEVLRQSRIVLSAAQVELHRLLGFDVTVQEGKHLARGWPLWRDLLADSSDSETDEPSTDGQPDDDATITEGPQLRTVLLGTQLCVVLPVANASIEVEEVSSHE